MSHQRPLIWGGLGCVVLALAIAYFWMNRGYGEVSGRSYEYATALFSACNQKDEERLQRIAGMVAESVQQGEISQQEADWLQAIIDDGLSGSWLDASHEVRQLMEDQINLRPPGAAPPGPHEH